MESDDVTRSIFNKMRRSRTKKEFDALDVNHLSRLSDKELADWHASQQSGSPQDILAANEWQRRITMRQVRAAYHTAFVSGIFGLLGVALGWWLSEASKRHSDERAQAKQTPEVAQVHAPPKPPPRTPPVQAVVAPKPE